MGRSNTESSSECGKNKLQNLRLMDDRLSGKTWIIPTLKSAIRRVSVGVHPIDRQRAAQFALSFHVS